VSRRRRASGGFTLVELMIVVAIISIVAAVAIGSYRTNPTGDAARSIAALMATAYRVAIAGGPIRADVATQAEVAGGRALLEFEVTPEGHTQVTVRKVVEGEGDGVYTLEAVQSIFLHEDVTLFKVLDSAQIGLSSTAIEPGGLPATKRYYPPGSADPYTIYLRHRTRESATRYRVVGMPLSPAPQVFQDW
jgi:prepilin-type N-terminal cleavage/methylation domain-containing protein